MNLKKWLDDGKIQVIKLEGLFIEIQAFLKNVMKWLKIHHSHLLSKKLMLLNLKS